MKEYVFDERTRIENMINCGYVDESNITYTIKDLARYNFYVLGLDSKSNYEEINNYMNKNCDIYSEVGYQKIINGCIRDTQKRPFANISNIIITKKELETISKLNDIREEKIAFVLLADVKYSSALLGIDANVSFLNNPDLYRLARVTMPRDERNIFLSFLYSKELVEININPKFTGKKLLYISDDDDVGLILNESNYKELAFTYLNWKKGGYKECEKCGRLIKIRRNTKYCKNCSPKFEAVRVKTIRCIDCGKETVVSSLNNQSCRCDDCYSEYRRAKKTETMQKLRAKN